MAPVVCFGALVVALVFTLRTCHVVALLTEASSRQSFSGWGMQETDYNMRYRALLRDEVVARLKQLGNVSDANDFLQRTFLSPAAVKAGHLIEAWMQDAGLLT
jgi:allantoate deiminase